MKTPFRRMMLGLPCLLAACATDGDRVTAFSVLGMGGTRYAAPADIPPADYTGKFWVDRRGCSYIRAGDGAEVMWVPQLDSARRQICDRAQANDVREDIPFAAPPPETGVVSIDPETGLRSTVIPPIAIAPSYVRIGAYENPATALAVAAEFRALGFPLANEGVPPTPGQPTPVDLGPFTVASALEDARLMAAELGYPEPQIYSIR